MLTMVTVIFRPHYGLPLQLFVLLLKYSFSHALVWNNEAWPSLLSRSHSALQHATIGVSDPIALVDSSQRGGCPFLPRNSVKEKVSYSVPTLFRDDPRPILLLDEQQFPQLSRRIVRTLLQHDTAPYSYYNSTINYGSSIQDTMDHTITTHGQLRLSTMESTVGQLLLHRRNASTLSDKDPSPSFLLLATHNDTYSKSSAIYQIIKLLANTSSNDSDGSTRRRPVAVASTSIVLHYALLRLVHWMPVRRLGHSRSWGVRRDRRHCRSGRGEASTDGRLEQCQMECNKNDKNFRYVDDHPLTGGGNLFEGANPPKRGDMVRIIYPTFPPLLQYSPSVSFDEEEFPQGICLIGGMGTIATVDLPTRIVVRVQRSSLGLKKKKRETEEDTVYAWVKPCEVAWP